MGEALHFGYFRHTYARTPTPAIALARVLCRFSGTPDLFEDLMRQCGPGPGEKKRRGGLETALKRVLGAPPEKRKLWVVVLDEVWRVMGWDATIGVEGALGAHASRGCV